MTQFTKKAIRESFLTLLRDRSLDKITVKDIVEECGINRNTFYYYYQDIYDLIADIFDYESRRMILEEDQSSDWKEAFARAINFVIENRTSIQHLYYSKSRDVLEKYLVTITSRFVKRYVEKEAEGMNLSEQDREFVIVFYRWALLGTTLSWIQGEISESSQELIQKVDLLFEDSLRKIIQKKD